MQYGQGWGFDAPACQTRASWGVDDSSNWQRRKGLGRGMTNVWLQTPRGLSLMPRGRAFSASLNRSMRPRMHVVWRGCPSNGHLYPFSDYFGSYKFSTIGALQSINRNFRRWNHVASSNCSSVHFFANFARIFLLCVSPDKIQSI